MFERLSEGLQGAIKSLSGKGRLTEANMREGLKQVEQSLLEADVSYDVVQSFMDNITEKALGEKVLLSLDPSEQVIGIVRDELIDTLGTEDSALSLDHDVNIIMLCGLQGSGKTTTTGKLARLIRESGGNPMLVAADLQRAAAVQQLHVLGEQLDIPVYSEAESTDPVKVCQNGVKQAKANGANVVILDTAGRLAIDEELMAQLVNIDRKVQPHQVFLVVDGMTGQDAVNSAKAFNEALELDGVIMTKLDGDARGGALLSVKSVTGVPIKFIGTGEHLDSLEPFRPEGMAGRSLGLGDILGLVDVARQVVDEQQQAELEEKLQKGQFTLDDFKTQLASMAQPGLVKRMLGMLGGPMGQMNQLLEDDETEGGIRRTVGIINSMTLEERRDPSVISGSRRNRIAQGAGVQGNEVTQLIKQYEQMKPMMEGMAGKGMRERLKAVRELHDSAMANPLGGVQKNKKSTGTRLSSKDKRSNRKEREKLLKQVRRRRR
ncbi:MAG: signal recognition particle protein [Planctomycetota bacterium]|nr:signal recognition particle protein [Planctomycetota bacterium]